MVSRRRTILSAIALAGALLAPAPPALAQARPDIRLSRVGLVIADAPPKAGASNFQYDGVARGLGEQGWVVGANVILETRYAAGRMHRIEEFVRELVALRVDVLVVAGKQGQDAVRRTGGATPAILVSCDPQDILVAQLPRLFGTTTGITCASDDLAGQRLALLKSITPGLSRVAVTYNPGDPNKGIEFDRMREPAARLGLSLRGYPIERDPDFAPVFAQMKREGNQAVVVLTDPYFIHHAPTLAGAAIAARLPAVFGFRRFVESGGLLSYGADLDEAFRRAGNYAGQVLNGTDPRNLPLEKMSAFELTLNRGTATALGLEFPAALLQQADRVIE